MSKPKWFVTSRGVMGPAVAILAILLTANGIEFDAEEQSLVLNQLDGVVAAGIALAGSIVGIWGRIKASQPVAGLPSKLR